jgi:hypothetical protein
MYDSQGRPGLTRRAAPCRTVSDGPFADRSHQSYHMKAIYIYIYIYI